MSFAKVTIVGNLGRDPETRYTQNGTLIISFTIAAQGRFRTGGQQQTTTWFRVSAVGQQAERVANMVDKGYINKGKLLYVEGQLEENTFTGNDGQERKSLEVTLTDWQFVGGGRDDQQQGGNRAGGDNQDSGQGNFGGSRNDSIQESSGSYGGSKYGSEFPSGDDPSDLNDVPF